MVRYAFPTLACKEIKLGIVEIRVAGMAVGFYKLTPGNGFMLDIGVALLAFDLMIRDMVLVHQFGIIVEFDFLFIGMATTAADFRNASVPHHHIAMTFLALNGFFQHPFMIIDDNGIVSLFSGRWGVTIGAFVHAGIGFEIFKMAEKAGAFGNRHMAALDDLGMATGTS